MKKYLACLMIVALCALTASAVAQVVPQPKLSLTWTDTSTNEDGFKVERGAAMAGPFTILPNGTTAPNVQQFDDIGLPGATNFCYRVKAFNSGGDSAYLGPLCRVTQAAIAVTKSGVGTVTSATAGISCGAICAALFAPNIQVTLTAVAAAGHQFTGWSGACTGTTACVVTTDGRKDVTATFAVITPPPAPTNLGIGD